MDHPSRFHHQHQHARYAPLPPRNSQFPDDPRLHPHHLPPPPPAPALPPPPPPPNLSYRTIHTTPPPHTHPHPYNPPHQSQFPFNAPNYAHRPVEEERPISANLPHDFTHSQRVPNRMLIDNDRPRHSLPDFDHRNSDNRIGVWNPPRVLSDNRPSRPYPPVDFDRKLHHQHPLNHKTTVPYPPMDKLRYDSESSSRLRVDHIDEYEIQAREKFVWDRGDENYHRRRDFGSNLDSSSGDFGVMSSQSTLSRDIDSKSGGYGHLYSVECDNEISRVSRRDELGDSKRWISDRKTPRDSHNSSFELGNNENGAGTGMRVTSGKYYVSELGRYNNKVNRECAHEFTRIPKKQIQKKSALLRIQMVKPNHRNREIEQLHYSTYADDPNSNSFRGKDQFEYAGYGMKAEEREGSPVELDISFKSNSLVAKAIVAPSSSAVVSATDMTSVSDTDLTSAEKRKNVLVSGSDCSDLKTAKPSNLNSSPCKANVIPSSGKDFNLQKDVSDNCSHPCSSATHTPHGKNEEPQPPKGIVSDETTLICSGKTSPRVARKKKIVKKVVKKVVLKPNLHVSSSISANMLDGTAQADSVTLSPSFTSESGKTETSLKEKITAVDKVSMPDCLQSFPREGHLLPDNSKGDIPLLSLGPDIRLLEYKTDDNSDIGQVARTERSENISNSPLCASSIKDNFDVNLHSMPNTDKVAKSLNGSTYPNISTTDDVNMQFCQNEVSLSPEKYSNIPCLENRYPVEDDKNGRLSSLAESVINNDLINTCNSSNVRIDGLSSNDVTGNALEIITVCDIGNDGKAGCKSQALALTGNAILEESPETSIPASCSGMVGLSSSGNTRIQDGPECLQHSRLPMHASDNGSTSSDDNITVPHSGIVNDSGKQESSMDVTISPENCATERFPNSESSVRFGEVDANKSRKRKVQTHINFSSSNIRGISPDPIHPVSLANVDTTLSMLKDPSPSEVLDPDVQNSDFSLQSSMDRVTVLKAKEEISKAEVSSENIGNNSANRASPMSKRNEVSSSHLNLTSCGAKLCDAIVVATSCAEVPNSICDNRAHQKVASMAKLSTSQSLPYPEDYAKLPDNSLVGGSFESMDANRETMNSECSKVQHPTMEFHSLLEDLAISNGQFPMLDDDQRKNATPVVPTTKTQKDNMFIGNIERENIDIQAVENCQSRDFIQRSLSADLESSDLHMKDDLPLEHDCLSCPADTDGVTISNSNTLSDVISPGTTVDIADGGISDCSAIQNESIREDEEIVDSSSMVDHGSDLPSSTLSSQHIIKNTKSDHATGCNNLGKVMPQPLQVYSKFITQGLNSSGSELNGGKNQQGFVIPTTFQGQSSFAFPKSKTSAFSTPISKFSTWHRTGNNSSASLPRGKPSAGIVPPKRSILEKKGKFQNTSYIRKGSNSLVRKHTPVSALPQGSGNLCSTLGLDKFQKSIRSESKVDVPDQTSLLKAGLAHAPLERQRTPPLPIDTKVPNLTTTSSEENRSSPLIEPLSNANCEGASEPRKSMEPCDAPNLAVDALKSYEIVEIQTGPSSNGESQVEANDGNLSSLNSKRIVYVKRKSNQLVATSNSCDLSVSADDNAQTGFSDSYYKRSKNQLVRTTFESHINQTVATSINAVNSDGQGTRKVPCNRRFSRRRSHKVVGSSCKPLRASLVWTLYGTNSSKNDSDSAHHQKVLPHLFPWKRATYLRSFIHNPALSSNSSSLSAIGKKLLVLRKRDTVYTRSTHGFSLRKSKVLGVGGSSLKWSKSIERCSKKANEEATLAVAAVERKKREQKDVACISSRAKRERIFRIGSVRYRMDPSGRTLHRISDDESLSSASVRSGLHSKRSYIPRRLVIGNDEYIRIGNGHQLIRDPKKRTRILANEKIRWSLHTARQRLARKQKYCQFFTRFGKCNKDDRKCPYIHDPSKIAVCTKFLNGLCSTPNCKLTHKVMPERMPDCSYFVQGLCTNRSCPYRHVNVNPKASICEGFLRGYCADGNECPKKHTYVCPAFEATGICTQGTKCKLHHPKKQSKGKKRKRSGDQNGRGRYFGSVAIDVSEPGTMVAPRQGEQNNDDLEGDFTDYISLDVDDEDGAESIGQPSERATLCDSEPLDMQLYNLDELIKPVLIMK